MIKKQRITLSKIISSPNSEVAYLKFKLQDNFEFKEWQFMMLEKLIDWKKIKRAYSIANTYNESLKTWELDFFVKRTSEEWMSYFLTQKIRWGDFLDISWPYWNTINDFSIDDYLLISIWSGCASIMPIYKKIVWEEKKYNRIASLFGEKTFEYLVDTNKNIFERTESNVKNMFFLSREKSLENATTQIWSLEIEKGHISDGLWKAIKFLWTNNVKVFICGKPEMVDQTTNTLTSLYMIDRKNIKFEKY